MTMLDTVLDRKTLQLAYIRETLEYSAELKRRLARENAEEIFRMAECITEAFKRGNKLLICGNGGSAADAQHIATEFTIRYRSTVNRPAMPAIALTTDSSALTGGANDLGYDNVFARLVEAWGKPGDVLLGIFDKRQLRERHSCNQICQRAQPKHTGSARQYGWQDEGVSRY